MKTVSFITFGCKLNQAETAALVQDFEVHGYQVVPDVRDSDVVVINSCTVTGRADAKCRRAIRRVRRINSRATVIVVGCYSQMAYDEVSQIPGVDYILGSDDKFRIFKHLKSCGKLNRPKIKITPVQELTKAVSPPGNYLAQTRAFLKIQDGCNRFCSYCIVPLARGPSRSVSIENVIHRVKGVVDSGYKEIVLTGVHIGDYGKDVKGVSLLPELLTRLVLIRGLGRIRLSSLDPEDVTEALLDCIEATPKICRHFHIPLQSGCDSILKLMKRGYNTEIFRQKVEMIIFRFKNVGLGSDIIVGHPGETDTCFEQTYQFVEKLPLTYLHVFPFSLRKGTASASMPDRNDPGICIERARRLRDLGEKKKRKFIEQNIGRKVNVLFEIKNREGKLSGFSSEYIRVEVPFFGRLKNRLVNVRISSITKYIAQGTVDEKHI